MSLEQELIPVLQDSFDRNNADNALLEVVPSRAEGGTG